MASVQRVMVLLCLDVCLLIGMSAWWWSMSEGEQRSRLAQIAVREAADTFPPSTLLAQAEWLVRHRGRLMYRLLAFWGLVVVISGTEGLLRRTTDPFGGFLQRWWTLAQWLWPLSPGMVAVLFFWPAPLPMLLVGVGGALYGAVMSYGLMAGYPYGT